MAGGDLTGPDDHTEGEDPFDGIVLDASFVADATVRESSAEERLARLRRIEEGHQRVRDEWSVSRAVAARDERRKRWLRLGAVAALVAVVAAVAVGRFRVGDAVPAAAPPAKEAPLVASVGPSVDRPTPAGGATGPLGVPPPVADDDRFVFISTQPGSAAPVAPDPCRVLSLVVNDRARPDAAGDGLVREAIDEVAAATGLRIQVEGPTAEAPSTERDPVQRDRYGDRWAPVLLAWSDPGEVSALDGDVAGIGGGQAFAPTGEEAVYVTGQVVLDGPQIDDVLDQPGGVAQARAIVMHELAHLVGLDHIDDPSQLMHPRGGTAVTTFAPGDRAGLAALGQGACFPDV